MSRFIFGFPIDLFFRMSDNQLHRITRCAASKSPERASALSQQAPLPPACDEATGHHWRQHGWRADMDIAAAADRHYDSLMDAADRRAQAIEDRADEIYNDLWDQCKADPKAACALVDLYCEDPYDLMAQILIHAAERCHHGVTSTETRAAIGAFVMAKLTGILSDAADDKAEAV